MENIREACTEIAEEVLGRKDNKIRSHSKTVKDLSETQKKMKLDIKATKDKNKRERNKIINTLHKETEKEEMKKLNGKIEEIEKCKDDSNRMFQVTSQLQPKEIKKI